MRLKSIRSDLDLEKQGIWRTYGEGLLPAGEKPGRFLIARHGTPNYRSYVDKLQRPHSFSIRQGGDGADEILRDIVNKAMSRFILIDWEDLTDDDGNPFPYSEAAAYEILSDPTMHDFREWVLAVSINAANYRAEVAQETVGNSDASSPGGSGGDASPAPSQAGPVAVE